MTPALSSLQFVWTPKNLVCKVCVSCWVVPNSLLSHRLQPTRLLCPWDFSGKNTRVGRHFLLQGIFPNQESNQVSCIAADSLPSEAPGISSQKPQVWKCQHLGAYFRAKSFRRDTSSTLQKKVNNKKQILWLLSREGEHAKFTLDKQLKLYCHVSTFQSENKHDRCSFGCSSTFHLNGNSSSLRLQPEVIIYYCFCIIPLPRQKAECSTYISRPMRGNKV